MTDSRRDFLKILGLTSTGVLAGPALAIATSRPVKKAESDALKLTVEAHKGNAKEIVQAIQKELRRVPKTEQVDIQELVLMDWSRLLDYELMVPIERQEHIAMQGDRVGLGGGLEVERLYIGLLLREEVTHYSKQDLFKLYFEPALISLGREINRSGYKYSFPMMMNKYATQSGLIQGQSTSGRVPIRMTCRYNVPLGGYECFMEVQLA